MNALAGISSPESVMDEKFWLMDAKKESPEMENVQMRPSELKSKNQKNLHTFTIKKEQQCAINSGDEALSCG